MYTIFADIIVVAHFLFIVFVILGGFLVIRHPKAAFIHLPAAIWGAAIEFFGWVCPLTPLENYFRNLAGEGSYSGDFIYRYLIPVIYPTGLTISIQQILGTVVVLVNVTIYSIAITKNSRKPA